MGLTKPHPSDGVILLECASFSLFALNGFDHRLKVAEAEAAGPLPLDDLKEQCRPVDDGFGEYLQEIPFRIAIGKDTQISKRIDVHRTHIAESGAQTVTVIRLRYREELDAPQAQLRNGMYDVVGLKRDVLYARAAVEFQIFLDLRFAFAKGGLVDREFHLAGAIPHHFAHERCIFRRDLAISEVNQIRESHDAGIIFRSYIHLAERDIADDMVDRA